MEITNVDPNQSAEIELNVTGINAKSASGETLTAPKVDSVNTFEAPERRRAQADFGEGTRRKVDSATRT